METIRSFCKHDCTIFNKPGCKASPYHNLENGLNQTCFSMSSCFVQLLFWIFRNFKSFLLTVVSSPLNGFSTHPSSHPDLSLLFGKTSFLYPTPFLLVDGSPKDQLLTIHLSVFLTACSPSQEDKYLNLFPVHHDRTETSLHFTVITQA